LYVGKSNSARKRCNGYATRLLVFVGGCNSTGSTYKTCIELLRLRSICFSAEWGLRFADMELVNLQSELAIAATYRMHLEDATVRAQLQNIDSGIRRSGITRAGIFLIGSPCLRMKV